MPHKCARAGCDRPGLIKAAQREYLCPPHADEARAAIAAAASMAAPPPPMSEQEQRARQLAHSASLEAVFPALRDPAVLAQQIGFWREIESEENR